MRIATKNNEVSFKNVQFEMSVRHARERKEKLVRKNSAGS